MIELYTTGFARPPVLTAGPISDFREVILSYHGGLRAGCFWLSWSSRLPLSQLTQRTRAKALFKLFLIYSNRPGDADNTIGGYLALPDPKIDRISGNPESISNFAYFRKSWRHRHDLVL